MALSEYEGQTNYISELDDLPNDEGGLTADELKAVFDRYGTEFTAWFNETHKTEVEAEFAAVRNEAKEESAEIRSEMPNRNLLHNWDFRNPVNQRGQSSYSGAGYTIDMWRLDRGSSGSTEPVVSVVSGGLSIEVADKAAFLKQFIEADLTGIPVTFSAMAGDTVYSVHCENPSTTGGEYQATENTPFGSIRFGYDAGKSRYRVTLYCNVAATTTFSCAKLERGAISTLANDPPADYGTELLKCSRYLSYIINGYQGRAAYVGTNDMHFDIPLPVPMRAPPSIVDASDLMVRSLTASVQTGFSFNVTAFGPAYLRLTASKTGHGLTDAQIFANGQVLFSAEL